MNNDEYEKFIKNLKLIKRYSNNKYGLVIGESTTNDSYDVFFQDGSTVSLPKSEVYEENREVTAYGIEKENLMKLYIKSSQYKLKK